MRVAALCSEGPVHLQYGDRPEPAALAGARQGALARPLHEFSRHLVVDGILPSEDGRIPVSDAAGEVLDVGEGVTSWRPGDRVMSTFFPDWQGGDPITENARRLGGDSVDGCAAEISVVPGFRSRGWSRRCGISCREAISERSSSTSDPRRVSA